MTTFVAVSANAATQCASQASWTIAQLGAAGCEIGDKLFSNFTGSAENASDTFMFSGPTVVIPNVAVFYTMNVNAGTEFVFSNPFTFAFDVSIIQNSFIPVGTQASISRVSGGIGDAGAVGSSGTLTKTVTGGANCTLTVVDPGTNPTAGTCTGLNAINPIHVVESFAYTGTAGQSTITSVVNAFAQTFTPTSGTPEPMSMLLFGSGLLGVALIGRKRSARNRS